MVKNDSRRKRDWLFKEQKETLDRFLERGAISQEQYETSLRELTKKMSVTVSE